MLYLVLTLFLLAVKPLKSSIICILGKKDKNKICMLLIQNFSLREVCAMLNEFTVNIAPAVCQDSQQMTKHI